MAVDRIADDHGFAPWRAKFHGEMTEGRLGDEKVLLLKPGTFMNLSGQSVNAALQFYKIPIEDAVVLHDELDLAPGKCRVKRGGGHAGHNGLRSIHQHCGPDYGRVRLWGSLTFIASVAGGGWLLEGRSPEIIYWMVLAALVAMAMAGLTLPDFRAPPAHGRGFPLRRVLGLTGFIAVVRRCL